MGKDLLMHRRISSIVWLGAAAALLATAGCGAGQITQTDTQIAAVNGEQGQVGALRISNAELAYPAGEGDGPKYWPAKSDVALAMSISNNGEHDDVLQQVTADVTKDVQVDGDKKVMSHRTLTVGGPEAESGGEVDAGADAGKVGNATIVLRGIDRNLFPGQVVQMTLTFSESGTVKLRVPIASPDDPRVDPPHEPAEH